MPYEEQLAKKQKQAIRQLRNFRKKLVPLAELTPERKAQLAWIYEK
jgi:tRNA/tmRNA/rRNA uracil-C5-methylase (TrmA/RlmC/RlmD family)